MFNIGNGVECIDASGRSVYLTNGGIYTVMSSSSRYVEVANDEGFYTTYSNDRFRLATTRDETLPPYSDRELRVGDKVKCIAIMDSVVEVGAIGIIKSINPNSRGAYQYYCKWINGSYDESGTSCDWDNSFPQRDGYWHINRVNISLIQQELSQDTLIKRANMGIKALNELHEKYPSTTWITEQIGGESPIIEYWDNEYDIVYKKED